MQFMWRDATSKFGVLGPYYPSISGLTATALHGAATWTPRLTTWDPWFASTWAHTVIKLGY